VVFFNRLRLVEFSSTFAHRVFLCTLVSSTNKTICHVVSVRKRPFNFKEEGKDIFLYKFDDRKKHSPLSFPNEILLKVTPIQHLPSRNFMNL
jgi:hypothetical protein